MMPGLGLCFFLFDIILFSFLITLEGELCLSIDLAHHMAIDGQPAGEDTIGPGAGIGLGLVVIDALLQAVTHGLDVLEVFVCELCDNALLIESLALREESHFLHKALDVATGATMCREVVVQELLVDIIGHVIILTAFLMRLHSVIVRADLKLAGNLQGTHMA